MKSMKRILGWVTLLAVVLAMGGLFGKRGLVLTSNFEQSATTVWYCAGEAVNEHADPYRVEPLRSCEKRYEPIRKLPWVEPAPLPGYALAAFSLMARLPFALARTLWFYLLIAAVVVSAIVLARLTRLPVLLVMLCLGMADGYFNLFYGELPPLAVAVLVVAAALGTSQRYVAAALAASIAMIEPHLGLPACLAMFAWWPGTRRTFIVTAAGLAALSVAAIGIPANIEYVTAVLPAHAASEIAAQDQYSLSRLLHILGVADAVALKAGSASYLIMTLLGVALARRIASAIGSDALIVLLPPATALLGGPFVHDIQMAAALPAAIILAASTRPPLLLRTFALVALVFPWHAWSLANLHGQVGLLEMGAVAAAVLVATRTQPVRIRTCAAVLSVAACVVIGSSIEAVPRMRVGPPTTIMRAAISPTDLSSTNWAAFVSRDHAYSTPDVRDVLEKIPLWLGLIALTSMAAALPWSRRRMDAAFRESAPLGFAPHLTRGR